MNNRLLCKVDDLETVEEPEILVLTRCIPKAKHVPCMSFFVKLLSLMTYNWKSMRGEFASLPAFATFAKGTVPIVD